MCLLILILCMGCQGNQPPLEFAPNATIIEKGIMFKLQKQHEYLSQHLQTQPPKLKVTKINIQNIQPTIINSLSTYHLEGTYKLNIQQKNKKNRTINNSFNLDLQRQAKGDTWRILIKAKDKKYYSYHIY